VSLGIATTKTLSKVATEIVKQHPLSLGVLSLVHASNEELDKSLENLPIQDVWGIGSLHNLPAIGHIQVQKLTAQQVQVF